MNANTIVKIPLTKFAERVSAETNVRSVPLIGEMFEVDQETGLVTFGERNVSATTLYQVKSATGSPVDVRGFGSTQRAARLLQNKKRDEAIRELTLMANGLNASLSGRRDGSLLMRVTDDEYVGGVVTKEYTPYSHVELVNTMLNDPFFETAVVVKHTMDAGHLDMMVMMGNEELRVDGGLKNGLKVTNSQFGDQAASFAAMLFRLLCTNGMIATTSTSSFRRRHSGNMDFHREMEALMVSCRALFTRAKASMEIEVDVRKVLIEAFIRGWLTAGAFVKAYSLIDEVAGGDQVLAYDRSLWGLTQALAAAARDYAMSTGSGVAALAGSLIATNDPMVFLASRRVDESRASEVNSLLAKKFGHPVAIG